VSRFRQRLVLFRFSDKPVGLWLQVFSQSRCVLLAFSKCWKVARKLTPDRFCRCFRVVLVTSEPGVGAAATPPPPPPEWANCWSWHMTKASVTSDQILFGRRRRSTDGGGFLVLAVLLPLPLPIPLPLLLILLLLSSSGRAAAV